jgi:hypothetical protein
MLCRRKTVLYVTTEAGKTLSLEIPTLPQRSNPPLATFGWSMPMNHKNKKYPDQKYLAFLRTLFPEIFQYLNAGF